MSDHLADVGSLIPPGRKTLYLHEVARLLEMSTQHVRDLIEEGKLHAVDVGGGGRKSWRVPTTAYERFLKERSSLGEL